MGISPTKNESDILKAYAEQVKNKHPEDYPEEWCQLHDACQKALRIARGADERPFISVKEPNPNNVQKHNPESEYAEEFREALRQNENIAEQVIQTVQGLKKEKGFLSRGKTEDLMELLPKMSPGQKENAEAVKEVTELLTDSRLTREACERIWPQMHEWYWSCPQTAQRDQIKKALDSVSLMREDGNRQKKHGITDALFAFFALLFMASLFAETEITIKEYVLFLLFTACIGFMYMIKTWKPQFVPSEKKRTRDRVMIFSLLLIFLCSCVGLAVSQIKGTDRIEGRIERTYLLFSPVLEEKTHVYASLSRSPTPVCFFLSSFQEYGGSGTESGEDEAKEGSGTYYLCEDTRGQQFLVFADTGTIEEHPMQSTGTIYGILAPIHSSGIFLDVQPKDPALEIWRSQGVHGEDLLRALGDKIGRNPVMRYTGTEPEYTSVVIGYEPGHSLHMISLAALTGVGIYLALILVRRIPIRVKTEGKLAQIKKEYRL